MSTDAQRITKDILRAARRQGWSIERQRNRPGWALTAPTGERTIVHCSYSDARAPKHVIARLRRQGFVWPPPKKSRKGG